MSEFADYSIKDIERLYHECAQRGRQRNAAMKKVKALMTERAGLLAALRECADLLHRYHTGDDSAEGQAAQEAEQRARAVLAKVQS